MHQVFISYSSKDLEQAEAIRNILEKNAIPCWMAPRDIPGGSNYTKEIPIAIRECQVFVLVLSANAQNSHWVLKELDSAVNSGKVILPFMLEDCQLSDEFNFLLTGAQRYSAYQKKAEAMETLIARIRAIAATAEPKPSEEAPVEIPEELPARKVKPEELVLAECPACGSDDVELLSKRIGRHTALEKLSWLIVPLTVVAGMFVGFLICGILYTVVNDPEDTVGGLIWMIMLCSAYAGGHLGNKLALEWVRRQRVRKGFCQNPYRCRACRKEFLLKK